MSIAHEDQVRDSPVPLPDPRYWGSKFWFTIHTIAYFYSETPTPTEMAHAKNFYTSLQSLLPCPGCAVHYTHLLKQFPVDEAVMSRTALMEWTNRIHNEVNRRLQKPVVTIEEYLMMNRNLERPPLVSFEPILLGLAVAAVVAAIVRTSIYNRA